MEKWEDLVIDRFEELNCKVGNDEWTVVAGIILIKGIHQKVIALASGLKCLPDEKLKQPSDKKDKNNEKNDLIKNELRNNEKSDELKSDELKYQLVRDCHAEVLVRRAFIRFLLIQREKRGGDGDEDCIFDSNCVLKDGISFGIYISHGPCGEATMEFVPIPGNNLKNNTNDTNNANDTNDTNEILNEEINNFAPDASVSSSTVLSKRKISGVVRGREFSNLRGVLRTKPARADSLISSMLSCSDKISLWALIGWQGRLAAREGEKISIDKFVIGDAFSETGFLEVNKKIKYFDASCGINVVSQFQLDGKSKYFKYGAFRNINDANNKQLKPSNVSYVWWETNNNNSNNNNNISQGILECIVDGRKFGSLKPKNGILKETSRSSLCTSNLFPQKLIQLKNRINETPANNDEKTWYERKKEEILNFVDGPFSEWKSFKMNKSKCLCDTFVDTDEHQKNKRRKE